MDYTINTKRVYYLLDGKVYMRTFPLTGSSKMNSKAGQFIRNLLKKHDCPILAYRIAKDYTWKESSYCRDSYIVREALENGMPLIIQKDELSDDSEPNAYDF